LLLASTLKVVERLSCWSLLVKYYNLLKLESNFAGIQKASQKYWYVTQSTDPTLQKVVHLLKQLFRTVIN